MDPEPAFDPDALERMLEDRTGPEPSPGLRASVMGAVRRELAAAPRPAAPRSRWWLAAAAAVVLGFNLSLGVAARTDFFGGRRGKATTAGASRAGAVSGRVARDLPSRLPFGFTGSGNAEWGRSLRVHPGTGDGSGPRP